MSKGDLLEGRGRGNWEDFCLRVICGLERIIMMTIGVVV